MALYVNTNVTSLRGQSSLNKATNSLATTYNRLSTGLRINSAKDDAAGLQISDRLTSQINGLTQGNRNSNDAIALTQTVEGAMDEMTTMLQRIRTLAVQSANGTNTTTDRQSIQAEVTALSKEITRIASKTTYGGKKILSSFGKADSVVADGTNKQVNFQVGANQNDVLRLDMSLKGKDGKVADKKDFSLKSLMEVMGGNVTGTIDYEGKNKTAYATVTGDKSDIESKTSYAVWNVSNSASAQATLGAIDDVINLIDTKRGDFGALENRLSSTISNQTNVANNESDARSRIRDTDYAEEASNLSAQSIVQQAASSMLTQANSLPQLALSLLG
ncbi:MAG: flagellin [Aeromonadales bacterium]|nr:flagellin [Aeromonadales bacterium]MDY2891093.1 flagellin [Succinivibrio sp.]